MKHYTAIWDDGHDWGEFEFESDHRANSKANIADAKETAQNRYGYNRAKQMRICRTMLCTWN